MVVQPSIGDLFHVVYRRKWTMLFVALIIVALGAAYLVTAIPTYRSTAAIVVRFGGSAVPVTNLARDASPSVIDSGERRELIQAHADILTSPDMAAATIEKVGLTTLYPSLPDHPPTSGTLMDAAIMRFGSDLFVSPEISGSVIRLGFKSPNPAVAKETIDALIDEYMRRENEIFSNTSYAFQKTQSELANAHLMTAQKELASYKAASGISDFDTQMNALIQQQSDLKSRLSIAQVSLAQASQKRDSLAQLLQTVSAGVTNSSGDKYRQVDEAQSRVNDLQARERELTATHGADWPAARAMRANIAEAQSTMNAMSSGITARRQTSQSPVYASMQTDLLRVTAESKSGAQAVSLMTSQLEGVGKQINALETRRAGLLQRQREVDLADSTYRSIAMSLEDSRISTDRLRDGISRVAVITQPNLPFVPSAPRYKLLSLAIAVSAALAGLLVGFARELIDDRFTTAKQVSGRLNVPVLATFDKA